MIEWALVGCFVVLLVIASFIVCFPFRRSFLTTVWLILIVIVGAIVGYWCWGDWLAWQQYTQEKAKQEQAKLLLKSIHDPKELIAKLKARVESQPNAAKGWYLLGRLYVSQNDWTRAKDVYLKAHLLEPDNEQITVNYVQSLWQLNHQQFDEKSRHILRSVLDKNPSQPDALAMFAMDAFLGHSYQRAIDYWERLLDIVPPQSEDAKAIRKAMIKAQKKLL